MPNLLDDRVKCGTRGGYVLILVVISLVAMLGMAALVIDLGMARLAGRQMQAAVESAAIEGIRWRDDPALPPEERERAWRQRASRRAGEHFDDNLLADESDPLNFGAGSVLELQGGAGDPSLAASQLLVVPALPVYKPRRADDQPGLETNADNLAHGDIVAGDYADGPSAEATDYSRDDFDPASADPAAVLVRMRRTNDFAGLDRQPGVSSAGPSLPLLFGRATFLAPADPGAGYSVRHHGFTVRRTSIAEARPAVHVGPSITDLPGQGVVPLTLTRGTWDALAPQMGTSVPVDGVQAGIVEAAPTSIGMAVNPVAGTVAAGEGFLPILDAVATSSQPGAATIQRVIGFGWARFEPDAQVPGAVTVTMLIEVGRDGVVAPVNASARLSDAWDALADLSSFERQEVYQDNLGLVHALLAPVTVR